MVHQAAGSRGESFDFVPDRRARFAGLPRSMRLRDPGRRPDGRPFSDEDGMAGSVRVAKRPKSMTPIIRRIGILLASGSWSLLHRLFCADPVTKIAAQAETSTRSR